MPSDNKKNPPLGVMEEGWNEEYISPFNYLLEYKGFLGLSIKGLEKQKNQTRAVFDTYPVYLKHSLLHDDETMKKVRVLEVSQRFFAFDKFRERGNKEYRKDNFEQALMYYERALSCFRWLEYKEDPEEDSDAEENKDKENNENKDKK